MLIEEPWNTLQSTMSTAKSIANCPDNLSLTLKIISTLITRLLLIFSISPGSLYFTLLIKALNTKPANSFKILV